MVRFATNGFFRFCRKCFGMKVERRFHGCTDIKCPLCLSKMRTPFGPFLPFLIGCMVSADYWLMDYPELRRTTQPSTIEPGFCIFCSTGTVSMRTRLTSNNLILALISSLVRIKGGRVMLEFEKQALQTFYIMMNISVMILINISV